MSNAWFQFKHFLIRQNRSAMKVTTDACLFGAWVAQRMHKKSISQVLDIGTGTGLLSLMLAQKIAARFDAVEINEPACIEASENVKESMFHQAITVHHCDVLKFKIEVKYNLIISNPPFFERSLRSPVNEVNLARHEADLSLDQLFQTVMTRLVPNGYFAVLLPFSRLDEANEIAARCSLQAVYQCAVRQTEKHDFFRVMIVYAKDYKGPAITEQILIKNNNQYGDEFVKLLQDYYLHL